jgi:hypothetical protein
MDSPSPIDDVWVDRTCAKGPTRWGWAGASASSASARASGTRSSGSCRATGRGAANCTGTIDGGCPLDAAAAGAGRTNRIR